MSDFRLISFNDFRTNVEAEALEGDIAKLAVEKGEFNATLKVYLEVLKDFKEGQQPNTTNTCDHSKLISSLSSTLKTPGEDDEFPEGGDDTPAEDAIKLKAAINNLIGLLYVSFLYSAEEKIKKANDNIAKLKQLQDEFESILNLGSRNVSDLNAEEATKFGQLLIKLADTGLISESIKDLDLGYKLTIATKELDNILEMRDTAPVDGYASFSTALELATSAEDKANILSNLTLTEFSRMAKYNEHAAQLDSLLSDPSFPNNPSTLQLRFAPLRVFRQMCGLEEPGHVLWFDPKKQILSGERPAFKLCSDETLSGGEYPDEASRAKKLEELASGLLAEWNRVGEDHGHQGYIIPNNVGITFLMLAGYHHSKDNRDGTLALVDRAKAAFLSNVEYDKEKSSVVAPKYLAASILAFVHLNKGVASAEDKMQLAAAILHMRKALGSPSYCGKYLGVNETILNRLVDRILQLCIKSARDVADVPPLYDAITRPRLDQPVAAAPQLHMDLPEESGAPVPSPITRAFDAVLEEADDDAPAPGDIPTATLGSKETPSF